ncbi:MAG: hypothetical protein ACXVA9_02570, partial [Bdellovibrionales bacterium]
ENKNLDKLLAHGHGNLIRKACFDTLAEFKNFLGCPLRAERSVHVAPLDTALPPRNCFLQALNGQDAQVKEFGRRKGDRKLFLHLIEQEDKLQAIQLLRKISRHLNVRRNLDDYGFESLPYHRIYYQ